MLTEMSQADDVIDTSEVQLSQKHGGGDDVHKTSGGDGDGAGDGDGGSGVGGPGTSAMTSTSASTGVTPAGTGTGGHPRGVTPPMTPATPSTPASTAASERKEKRQDSQPPPVHNVSRPASENAIVH
jgi:hypothetical protein